MQYQDIFHGIPFIRHRCHGVRLVLWRRPRWLLRLPDEGVLIPIGWEKVLPLGSRLFRSLKYRPRVLDAWVAELSSASRPSPRWSSAAIIWAWGWC